MSPIDIAEAAEFRAGLARRLAEVGLIPPDAAVLRVATLADPAGVRVTTVADSPAVRLATLPDSPVDPAGEDRKAA